MNRWVNRIVAIGVLLASYGEVQCADIAMEVSDSIRDAEAKQVAGDLAAAAQAYNRAVELGAGLAHPYYFRGKFRRDSLGELNEAKADFEQAVRLADFNDAYREELSETAARLGDSDLVLATARNRPTPELLAKSIVRSIRYGLWTTADALLIEFEQRSTGTEWKSPYKQRDEQLFLNKFRAMSLYGLERVADAERHAELYRKDAATLSHGFHMPGLVVGRIPPEPLREFDVELVSLRLRQTRLTPTEFLRLAKDENGLDHFAGEALHAVLSRGSQAKPQSSDDNVSLARIRVLVARAQASDAGADTDRIEAMVDAASTLAEQDLRNAIALKADATQVAAARAEVAAAFADIKSIATIQAAKYAKESRKLIEKTQAEATGLLRSRKAAEAQRVWDDIVTQRPNDLDLQAARFFSDVYQRRSPSEEMLAEAKRLKSILPKSHPEQERLTEWLKIQPIRLAEQRSDELYRNGQAGAALAVWDPLLFRNPGDVDIRAARYACDAIEVTRDLNREIEEGRDLLTCVPLDDARRQNIYATLFQFLDHKKQTTEQMSLANTWIAEQPNALTPRRFRARARIQEKEFEGALTDVTALVDTLGRLHVAGRGSPSTTEERKILLEDVSLLNLALESRETTEQCVRRGHARSRLGDDKDASVCYGTASELTPDSVIAHCWRATRLIVLGEMDAADAEIATAMKIKPNSAEAYACRGAASQARLQLDDARTDYLRAIELNPRLRDVHARLASIHAVRGEYEECYVELRCAQAVVPLPWPLLLPIRQVAEVPSESATRLSSIAAGKYAETIQTAQRMLAAGAFEGAYDLLLSIQDETASDKIAHLFLELARLTFGEGQTLRQRRTRRNQSPLDLALDLAAGSDPSELQRIRDRGEVATTKVKLEGMAHFATASEAIKHLNSELGFPKHYDPKLKQQALAKGVLPSLQKLAEFAIEDASGSQGTDPLLAFEPQITSKDAAYSQLVKIVLYRVEAEPLQVTALLETLHKLADAPDSVRGEAGERLYQRGRELIIAKQYDPAIAYLSLCRRLVPAAAWRPDFMLGMAYAYQGNPIGAVVHLEDAIEKLRRLDPTAKSPQAIKQHGQYKATILDELVKQLNLTGDSISGVELRREITELIPDHGAFANLGNALYFVGEKQEAEAAYERAIKLDKSGKTAQFIESSKKTMDAKQPTNLQRAAADRLIKTSEHREQDGSWTTAEADLRRAVELTKADPDADSYHNRLRAFQQRKDEFQKKESQSR